MIYPDNNYTKAPTYLQMIFIPAKNVVCVSDYVQILAFTLILPYNFKIV